MTPKEHHDRVSRKIGLSPGSLVHIGEHRTDPVTVRRMRYDAETIDEGTVENLATLTAPGAGDGVTWLDVSGVHDVTVVERIGAGFGLHPLLLEDIVNTNQRPKSEDYGNRLYVVVQMIHHDDASGELQVEQVSVVLGPNFVLTFQEKPGDVLDPVRERLRGAKGRIRGAGADYLAYAILDTIIDHYFTILEEVGDSIEEIEDVLLDEPTSESLQQIYAIKRTLASFRRGVWPLREAIGGMQRIESALVQRETLPYLRDVQDHTMQVLDAIETFRDMISGMLDLYMSSVSNRMNEVMKVLTVIATIFIPLTFIVGVYGMNFEWMPELHWHWGYPLVWLIMLGVGVGLVIAFRRKGWV